MMQYKRGDYPGALANLNKALDTCLQRSVGRLPYYLLQSHKAVVLSAMGSHDISYGILEEYVISLNTATTNPMGDIDLIETGKIVAHLLVLSFHNLSVQLAHLKRWDKAIEISARVLSLVESGMHQAQPMSLHFVHAHSASLRMGKAGSLSIRSFSAIRPDDDEGGQGRKKGKAGSPNSSMRADSFSLDSNIGDPREGRWNKWLAVAGQGRTVAPLLIQLSRPEVESSASLDDVPKRGFENCSTVLDAAAHQFPNLDQMEVCPDQVLGTVCRTILQFVDEGSYSNSDGAAVERFEQIENLLDEDLFECCGQLQWDVQVYGIMAKASFFYSHLEDYETTVKLAQRALEIATKQQEKAGYHVSICQLCIGACLLRAGQYDDAFSIGKAALSYCHGLSEMELQESNVRSQMEDVLVGSSHLMALAHIFLGNSKVALKLSKIAKQHIKSTSYYGDKSTLQFTQVSRVYEIAMSMNELTQDTSRFQPAPKRGPGTWVDKISRVVPNKFVPGALHRNLPELYGDRTKSSRRSGSAMSIEFLQPGEEVVNEILGKESFQSRANTSLDPSISQPGTACARRYSWTGRYSASLGQSDSEDAKGIASHSMTAPLRQQSNSLQILDNPRTVGVSAMSSLPASRMQTSQSRCQVTNRARGASTPYGQLETSGVRAPADPSLTGHMWVDELMHGKEEMRQRYASDPSSNVYFAKVYSRAKDQNSLLLDPLTRVEPIKTYVVGDHLRPQVGGARAPLENKPSSASVKAPHLLRDWGPDPTLILRRHASLGTRNSMSSIALRSHTSLGLHSEGHGNVVDLDVSDISEHARRASLKFDMNQLRVMKHAPFDSVVASSALGLFVSRGKRHVLLEDVDRYCAEKKARPVTKTNWAEATSLDGRLLRRRGPVSTAKSSVSRPWHWSHAPEPSAFLHSEVGVGRVANKHYRVAPYGQNLTPAAKQAYGTNGAPVLGSRSLQTVEVSQVAVVESAELSRRPAFSSMSTVSNRCLSGFV